MRDKLMMMVINVDKWFHQAISAQFNEQHIAQQYTR